jgi:CheY-like chemotaxis protein
MIALPEGAVSSSSLSHGDHRVEVGTCLQTLRMAATVLIVDDHPGFRAAARRLLELEGYIVVDAARELRPDFVLLDVQLPDIDGFEVAERLSYEQVSPAVVLTSSREASDYGPCLATTPACGFLPKAELSAAGIADILPA